jgi:hypothetical protein
VTLGTILGVGRDTQGTIYLADQVASTYTDRVFVSSGNTLHRKHILGSGQSGGLTDVDYTFSYEDGANSQALIIQVRGGNVTAMALGPSSSRAFIGGDPSQQPLTVLDPSAISGMALQNLPGVIEYLADVADGNIIVVTRPMDGSTYADFRLFYGSQNAMVERHVENVSRGMSIGAATYITFDVGSEQYSVVFTLTMGLDGGLVTGPGPGTLTTGNGATLAVTQRTPTPTSLPGFTFACL